MVILKPDRPYRDYLLAPITEEESVTSENSTFPTTKPKPFLEINEIAFEQLDDNWSTRPPNGKPKTNIPAVQGKIITDLKSLMRKELPALRNEHRSFTSNKPATDPFSSVTYNDPTAPPVNTFNKDSSMTNEIPNKANDNNNTASDNNDDEQMQTELNNDNEKNENDKNDANNNNSEKNNNNNNNDDDDAETVKTGKAKAHQSPHL